MDEITNTLKVANAAFKTVRVIDAVKKLAVAVAAVSCSVLVVRLFKK
ncbi:MAG: hypothetical protein IJE72_01595 [Clostridia bacterium]|nr:hypothetical protein [Clostridia bacterium]